MGIGCIGAGFIMADCHLVAYRNAGFNPIAIYSRSEKRAREVAARHSIPGIHASLDSFLQDSQIQVVDIAVPPDQQPGLILQILAKAPHIRGILAQKPLACSFAQARELVEACERAGCILAVNQNMRYDQSIRACKSLLDRQILGEPILATIEMRAVPHWLPWHASLGFLTLRNMSIHHLDAFRFLFGDPDRIFASVRPDPRVARQFPHEDGICLYILEYRNGLRASAWDDVYAGPKIEGTESDIGIRWRVEGTEGIARGTIGWPSYPAHTPSTLDYVTAKAPGEWFKPRWPEAWFPEAFAGPMAELLVALETGRQPNLNGRDNLQTMALVEAAYLSARAHRSVSIPEIMG